VRLKDMLVRCPSRTSQNEFSDFVVREAAEQIGD
jgi:hypothetical protein